MMVEKNLVVGPFQCNCRLIVCPKTGEGALIDPGDEAERILALIADVEQSTKSPLKIKYLLHTHAHLDHIGATRGVRMALEQRYGQGVSHIYLHKDDEELYRGLRMQGQLFGMNYDDPLPVDRFLEDEQELKIGTLKMSVIHTPGHSPGGVCLRLHEDAVHGARESLYSGDTLFAMSIGRTDLWGGDFDTLSRSIKKRLYTLDDDTRVCPGHGPETRIGVEKRENPFVTV